MKTKNYTEHGLLDMAVSSAANEDGISPNKSRDPVSDLRKQAWSPYEVWRTRVKGDSLQPATDPARR